MKNKIKILNIHDCKNYIISYKYFKEKIITLEFNNINLILTENEINNIIKEIKLFDKEI